MSRGEDSAIYDRGERDCHPRWEAEDCFPLVGDEALPSSGRGCRFFPPQRRPGGLVITALPSTEMALPITLGADPVKSWQAKQCLAYNRGIPWRSLSVRCYVSLVRRPSRHYWELSALPLCIPSSYTSNSSFYAQLMEGRSSLFDGRLLI